MMNFLLLQKSNSALVSIQDDSSLLLISLQSNLKGGVPLHVPLYKGPVVEVVVGPLPTLVHWGGGVHTSDHLPDDLQGHAGVRVRDVMINRMGE